MPANDDDVLRAAAFARLRGLMARQGDVLPFEALAAPFAANGTELRLMNRARGIFKPRAMTTALSVDRHPKCPPIGFDA